MSQVYPSPTIVIGVGRFGLAVLERLGEDWSGLRLSGADVSLQNLSLVCVRPEGTGAEPGDVSRWRRGEDAAVRLAQYLGGGDLPSLAVDLALLRCLGLVRFRDGGYQVALPRDGGVVDVADENAPALGREDNGSLRRIRYFEWLRLSPDPLIAAERLRYLTQRLQDLDLFVTPLLNRIRQGHSPRTLLACIGRWGALAAGRDPSPWSWPWLRSPSEPPAPDGAVHRIELGAEVIAEARRYESHLKSVPELPEPLPGWSGGNFQAATALPAGGEQAGAWQIRLPELFVPSAVDPETPLDPSELLRRDWANTGWAGEGKSELSATFGLLPLSELRLGLFDHDSRQARFDTDRFSGRLRELAGNLHRGLIRLWVDLQRERVTEMDTNVLVVARERDYLQDAVQQSLEILGELLVHPLGKHAPREGPVPSRPLSAAEQQLPERPSGFLSGLSLDAEEAEELPCRALMRRMHQLGAGEEGEDVEAERIPLLEEVALRPEDVAEPASAGEDVDLAGGRSGLRALHGALNRQVRRLFGFSLLARTRVKPTRRPPRLAVYLVADMSEPISRASARTLLREVHAELLRAFTPIFESYREGFDRSLSVTPILWMPHPADPFNGNERDISRQEEAAIIETVHGIRRWVEYTLQPGRRSISQIFINSRVTDTSTLSVRDAIRQTRDFLSFQIRNDLGGDPWLRRTATGSGSNDLFSSFSCYEIDFPALRCREYLANRLARDCLAQLVQGEDVRLRDEVRKEDFLPELGAPVDRARESLVAVTTAAAEELEGEVNRRVEIEPRVSAREIERAFDKDFELGLTRKVHQRWRELTGRLGQVDDMIRDLRIEASRLLSQDLDQVRATSDRLIQEHASQGGLRAAQAGFHSLRNGIRDRFLEREKRRRQSEELAVRHSIPELSAVPRARAAVLAAAAEKPDLGPIQAGLWAWGILSLVLGMPFAHSLAYLARLHVQPNFFEALVGPAAALTGGLLLFLPAAAAVRHHLRRKTRDLRLAVQAMGKEVARLLAGSGADLAHEPVPSIRSFLESRLELTRAVAERGFALRVLERAVADARLAYRLVRSADIQASLLSRRSEDLGVRQVMAGISHRQEDLRGLFDARGSVSGERLISPERLEDYYRLRVGRQEDLRREMSDFLRDAGGFAGWREQACLADTERALAYGRRRFDAIASEPLSDQHFFAEEAGERLVRFVGRCYSNLGFGARFRGYEGLDPDGIQVLADACLVLHPELREVFEKARRRLDQEVATTETLEVRSPPILPNAAFMMSLVQGIRVHSLRNLKRFESFHDRSAMPDDRAFPMSHEIGFGDRSSGPLNALSGFTELAERLARPVLERPDRPAEER